MNRVKVAMPVNELKRMRHWLMDNCGRRWEATDYKNQPWNWRWLGKVKDDTLHFRVTTWIDFVRREDMMLFLLVWPGEVAVYDSNEPLSTQGSDK